MFEVLGSFRRMPLYGGGGRGGCSFSFPLCSDACVVFTWSSSSRACAQNSFSLNFVGGCACVGTLGDPPVRRLLGDCCGQGWREPPLVSAAPGRHRLKALGAVSERGRQRRPHGPCGVFGGMWAMPCGAVWGLAAVARPSPRPSSWCLWQLCVFFSQCQWPRAGRGPASGCVLFSRGPVAPGRSRCCFRVRCFASEPVAPGVSLSCLRPF